MMVLLCIVAFSAGYGLSSSGSLRYIYTYIINSTSRSKSNSRVTSPAYHPHQTCIFAFATTWQAVVRLAGWQAGRQGGRQAGRQGVIVRSSCQSSLESGEYGPDLQELGLDLLGRSVVVGFMSTCCRLWCRMTSLFFSCGKQQAKRLWICNMALYSTECCTALT